MKNLLFAFVLLDCFSVSAETLLVRIDRGAATFQLKDKAALGAYLS